MRPYLALAWFLAALPASAALTDRVVLYDPDYDPAWVEQPDQIAAFFTRRGFTAKTVPEMAAWLTEHGAGTSAVFAMGIAPKAIVAPPFKDCLLARYLRAGGRVVWLTNIPMYIAQDEVGPIFTYGDAPRQELLGLTFDQKTYYAMEGTAQLTELGKAWGLEPIPGLLRPVHNDPPLRAFVTNEDGKYCTVGLVPFRDDVPRSGFIYQPDYLTPDRMTALRNAWRLASYDGEPVAVPDAAPLPPEPFPAEAALRFGERDERFCYLRGEIVPLYLRLRARQAAVKVSAELQVRDGERVLRAWQGDVEAKPETADTLVAHVDLGGLRVGLYPVTVALAAGGATQRIEREIRVSPPPDHTGTHVGLWVSTSPHLKRTDYLLRWLGERSLEPMFTDDEPLAHDLALWYGRSFSVRRHGEPRNIAEPPGYDEWRRSWNGEILRVGAQGGKRSSRGYASPFRRAAEAAAFGEGIAFDNRFPAFRKRAVTGDDYSQWFGMDYNRYAVEGFRARYGSDPPKPKEIEDSDEVDKVTRPPGIVPDDDPWLLLNRYWCEDIHGDMAGRLARAMRDHTDGTGRVGQISGGMQIPAMQLWSAQYPPFLFGPQGYNLTCFYYYNTYWQPPLAHLWWLEAARMGNRSQEEWIMPDCYAEGDSPASYVHFGWLCLAGGATGLEYFCSDAMVPAGEEGMRRFGKLSQTYGQLLGAIHPAPKKVGLLVPFEELVYKVTSCIELAYPFIDLLQAKVDVEPVSPEELTRESIRRYEALVLARTDWLTAGHAALLADYVQDGGKLICDQPTAKALNLPGSVNLDFAIGGTWLPDYAKPESLAKLRDALRPLLSPADDCDQPLVTLRRFEGDGTRYLWLSDNQTGAEYMAMRDALKAGKVAELAEQAGFGRTTVTTQVRRADDGSVPFDVLTAKPLPVTRAAGSMAFDVALPRWEGRLIALLPELPQRLEVRGPARAKPGIDAVFTVIVRGAEKPVDSLFPLHVAVTDPAGQPSREHSGRLLARHGIAEEKVCFAVNDLPGTWTLTVTDAMTGLSAKAAIELTK